MKMRQWIGPAWIGPAWIGPILLAVLCSAPLTSNASDLNVAAIDFGVTKNGRSTPGFMSCRDLGRQLVRNWLSLRDLLAPKYEKKERPKKGDFECTSAAYTQGMFEMNSARGSGLRCFRPTQIDGRGLCCDEQLSSCAYFNGEY